MKLRVTAARVTRGWAKKGWVLFFPVAVNRYARGDETGGEGQENHDHNEEEGCHL
jgi:hypothetical protein